MNTTPLKIHRVHIATLSTGFAFSRIGKVAINCQCCILLFQAWIDLVAPEIVTHEDIISIDAPQAAIHSRVPQPSKPGTAVTREERPETRVTHLSSWAPVLEEGKVSLGHTVCREMLGEGVLVFKYTNFHRTDIPI